MENSIKPHSVDNCVCNKIFTQVKTKLGKILGLKIDPGRTKSINQK